MTGDGWGLDDDDSPGSDVRARLEGRALLDLRSGTSDGPGVSSESGIVEIPEAPQGLPREQELVLGPGPKLELGPAPLSLVY